MFYVFIVVFAGLIWRIGFRITVIGRENIIKDRGFIMVCNHVSALDPTFLVLMRFFGKRMIVLGKKEIFNNIFSKWFLSAVGVVPIERGKGDTGLVNDIITEVKGGRGCLIFPEGTRSKDGNLKKLKSGALVIAQASGADIIPCRIIYKGGKMKWLGKVKVVYGTPISCAQLGLDGERSATALRGAKKMVFDAMENLLEVNRGDY